MYNSVGVYITGDDLYMHLLTTLSQTIKKNVLNKSCTTQFYC